MKMSELILAVGDNNVVVQNLLNDAQSIDKTKTGTKITFYTDAIQAEELLSNGKTKKLGLVLWLPRDRVEAAVATERADVLPALTKRVFDFINERDPFGDRFSEHDLQLIATLAPQPEDERLRKIIRQAVEAYDSGNLQLNSQEIGEPENDIPMHPWHEEWLHYARAAITSGERGD